MAIFASYFDLFAAEVPVASQSVPVEAVGAFDGDVSGGAELAASAIDASLAVFEGLPEAASLTADAGDVSTSYRNDTTGVGYVMDSSASNWQDMVWIDPD